MSYEDLEGLEDALKKLKPFEGRFESRLSVADIELIANLVEKHAIHSIESYSKTGKPYIDLTNLRDLIKRIEANCAKADELSKLPELAAYREALEAAEKALQELKEASGSKTVDVDAKRLGLVKCYLNY